MLSYSEDIIFKSIQGTFSCSDVTFLYFVQTPPVSSQTSTRGDKWEKVAAPAEDKPLEQDKPTKRPETLVSSLLTESGASKQKAAGSVRLFEETDGVGSKQTKLLDAANVVDGFLPGDSPQLTVKKEEKATKSSFSLFDDDQEDESDWNKPIFTSSKANAKNTLKVCEDELGLFVLVWSLLCLSGWVMFSSCVSLQRSKHRPEAQGCFRTRSSCSVRRSRRTTTQMLTSLPPQGKPQSVDAIFVSIYLLCLHQQSLSKCYVYTLELQGQPSKAGNSKSVCR